MWMDGALMCVPFLSLLIPRLTKVANVGWLFLPLLSPSWLFPHPPLPPTYLHLNYLPMHLGFLPPPPTYLPTHIFTYLWTYTLNLHQGNGNTGQWRYGNILGRLLCCPSYLPNRPRNFMTIKNNVAMTQMRVLQLNLISFL